MSKVSVNKVQTGMVTSQNIYSPSGQLIIPANTVITQQMISRLKNYCIPEIEILVGDFPEEVKASIARKEEVETQYSKSLTSTEKYKHAKKHYLKQVDIVKDSLNDIIYKNAPIEESDLLSETVALFEESPTTFALFGMLHNMQELDDSTYAHCVNVSIISRLMGTWLNLPTEELDVLTMCGLLHDIGKCKIPNDILLKPGKLTKQEYEFIKLHPAFGYDIIKDRPIDQRIKLAALQHHERCDGSGYPSGLSGRQIEDYSSIISIADVYDAMTANRCYRHGLCPFDVIAMFEEEGLNRYNPSYILTFLERIASSYVNSNVLLSNNLSARIIFINKDLTRPIVQMEDGSFINLEDKSDLYIQAIM